MTHCGRATLVTVLQSGMSLPANQENVCIGCTQASNYYRRMKLFLATLMITLAFFLEGISAGNVSDPSDIGAPGMITDSLAGISARSAVSVSLEGVACRVMDAYVYRIWHTRCGLDNGIVGVAFNMNNQGINIDGIVVRVGPHVVDLRGLLGILSAQNVGPIPAGTYRVSIEDHMDPNNPCVVDLGMHTVNASVNPIDITVVKKDTRCNEDNGEIDFSFKNSGYEYSLDGVSWSSSATFSGLAPGDYTPHIRAEDLHACSKVGPVVTIQPSSPPAYDVNAIIQRHTFCNRPLGEVLLAPTIQGLNYEFALYRSGILVVPWQSSPEFKTLSEGTYIPVIRQGPDLCPVMGAAFQILDSDKDPVRISDITNATCDDLTATRVELYKADLPQVVQNTRYYVFEESTNTYTYSNNGIFTGLEPIWVNNKTYYPGLEDTIILEKCTSRRASIPIKGGQPLDVVVNATDGTTCGQDDGAVRFVGIGGSGDYGFRLLDSNDNVVSSSLAFLRDIGQFEYDDLGPHTFKIRINDIMDMTCMQNVSAPFSIDPSTPLSISSLTSDPATCGLLDGDITAVFETPGSARFFEVKSQRWSTPFSGTLVYPVNNVGYGAYEIKAEALDGTCQVSQMINVESIGGLTIDSTVKHTSCGLDNGWVELAVSGVGGGPYEYQMNGGVFQSSNRFQDLAAGDYTFAARKDDGSCLTTTGTITVLTSTSIDFTVTNLVHTSCGRDNGAISVQGTGGSGGYDFRFSKGNQFISRDRVGQWSNLSSGFYTVEVIDTADGRCGLARSVEVKASSAVVAASSITHTSCNESNGSVTLSGSGGSGSYEYRWQNGNYSATDVFSGLSPGTYKGYVRDANDATCLDSVTTITVDPSSTITSLSFSQQPSTCGLQDGTLTVSGIGSVGLEVLDFVLNLWMPMNGGSYTIKGVGAGDHLVAVRTVDQTCLRDLMTTVAAKNPPSVSATTVVHTTCGLANGSVVLAGSGSTLPFEYSLDGLTWQASPNFGGLAGMSHTPWVRVAGQCETSGTPFQVNPSDSITTNTQVIHTACGFHNGRVTLSPQGSTGQYEYSTDGGASWSSVRDYPDLAAGPFAIQVRNTDGTCPVTKNISIARSGPFSTEVAQIVHTTCGQINGAVQLSAVGLAHPPEVSLDGTSWSTHLELLDLSPGSYAATIRSAYDRSCWDVSDSFDILPSTRVQYQLNVIPSDRGQDNGSITVAISSNGTVEARHPVTGQWSVVASQVTYDNLAPNTYTIDLRAVDGTCSRTRKVEIEEVIIIASVQAQGVAQCDPLPKGTLTVQVTEGGSGSYAYSLDGQNWQLSPTFTGLAYGQHQVWVRDQQNTNLQITLDARVDYLPPLTLDATIVQPTCGKNNGVINVLAQGGSGRYEYKVGNLRWRNHKGFPNLRPGTYQYFVRDRDFPGCMLASSTVELAPSESVSLKVTDIDAADCGNANGRIDSKASGSYGPFEYALYNTAGDNLSGWMADGEFAAVRAGRYQVWARDQRKCYGFDAFVRVGSNQTFNAQVKAAQDAFCGNDGLIELSASGGSGDFEFSLDGQQWQRDGLFNGLSKGTYRPRVRERNGTCTTTLEEVAVADDDLSQIKASVRSHTSCGLSDGEVSFERPAGLSMGLELEGTGTVQWTTGSLLQGLAPGRYKVYVRKQGICERTLRTLTIDPSEALNYAVTTKDDDCNQEPNGELTVEVFSAAVEFRTGTQQPWQPYRRGDKIAVTGLHAGTHSFEIRSSTCSARENYTVGQSQGQIDFTLDLRQEPRCGQSDGSIYINVTSTDGPYEYSRDGLQWVQEPLFEQLSPGLKQFFVRESAGDGCIFTKEIALADQSLDATIEKSDDTLRCVGDPLVLTINSPYDVLWSTGDTAKVIRWTPGSEAQISVEGFCLEPDTLTVGTLGSRPIVDEIMLAPPTGCSASDGSISFLAAQSYTYLSPDLGLSLDGHFTDLPEGTYSVAVLADDGHCPLDTSVTLVSAERFQARVLSVDTVECETVGGQVRLLLPDAGTGKYSFMSSSQASYLVVEDTVTIVGLTAGSHQLHIEAGTCADSMRVDLPAVTANPIQIDFLQDGVLPFCLGGSFDVTMEDTTFSYLWTIDGNSTVQGPSLTVDREMAVHLEATSLSGCTYQDSFQTTIVEDAVHFNFLLPSFGYVKEAFHAVDVSWPASEIRWEVSADSLTAVDSFLNRITFEAEHPGLYEVTMIGHWQGCDYRLSKEIEILAEGAPFPTSAGPSRVIRSLVIRPNPNDGAFQCDYELTREADIHVRIYEATHGQPISAQQVAQTEIGTLSFDLTHLSSDTYYLVFVAGNEVLTKSVVITR